MNAPATPSRAVTVLVTRRVAPQGVAGFEAAMAGMIEAATHFPGHLGGQLVRPGEAGGGDEPLLYHVVFAFDNDAHLAALAVEHRCGIVSFDNGFARFAGVQWSEPG